MRKPKSKKSRMQSKHSELQEVELLKSWIESQQPERGSNPTSLPALPLDARTGHLDSTRFSRYAGATRACLPHALCGRDVRGAAKTGSGKTLAFIIPIVEKLYRERWCPQDGVGSIIISPTREIAGQTFDVLRLVRRHHSFSAALLIGGRRGKDVDAEKELVNECNILVCTPGRLLQHMDETPHFDCSQLQLPKQRQTLLFSATQPKGVKDLAALCLKDPEFLSVHEKPVTATPSNLQQTFVIVHLHQKLEMLWRFIKKNLKSRVLMFLSTRKQVQFIYEAFTTLRPGISLMAFYGKLDQRTRMATVSEFSKQPSVLFSTDVASRGLDFNQGVDWVVQVDCPGDVASYIHRVGRTARYDSVGKSLLFLMPSEEKMLEKLQAAKIPIWEIKPNKNVVQSVSGKLADSIVHDPDLHGLAQSAFKTYLKSVDKKDKEIFDVTKLPIDEFSASIGLASTPRIRFLNNKIKSSSKKVSEL
ncbi:hypothetical protein C1H46_018295 [Malus baccata]|uniref:ATP-dependent RNA helicase n=1 Tax=Malus baccata TaxID=106549 RepID=A0A540MC61_MALBA|nr:hypothetical protein C1H46_018295 [Malus baccata]